MIRYIYPSLLLGFWLVGVHSLANAQEPKRRFPLPEPKYHVRVEKSVMVSMRDGARLSTDLYFPAGAGEKFPAITIRTPYNKNSAWLQSEARLYAGQGYVVALQDVRGKFESEGEYVVSAADTSDGSDLVDWIASQPWSTGKVGTAGCSYMGENQVEMARVRNPRQTAMIPRAASGGMQYFGSLRGGAFELGASADWFLANGIKLRPLLPAGVPHSDFLAAARYFDLTPVVPKVEWHELWRSLPLTELMKKVGAPPTDWEGFVSHAEGDPWWNQFGYVRETDRFDTPGLWMDSWYDYGVGDIFKLVRLVEKNSISARAHENQFIVIAPTVHCSYEQAAEHTMVGARDLGDAQFDYYGLYFRWFDYWLKGADNGVTRMPKVQLYVMGKNQWRGENEWPLARTNFTRYYLHSDGHGNGRFGSGTLDTKTATSEPPDHYVYDPGSPVPTWGGLTFGPPIGDLPKGAQDQSDIEMRGDVLVYSTPPLEKGVEVTGPIEVILYAMSDAPDTDFTAKLVDVYPDGVAFNIQEGIQRARYREGFNKKVWMKPGEVYKVAINLNATSNYFSPGHRIRLEVSSSNFPRFDRNLNTGGNNYDETQWRPARNTILHDLERPSHIVLPVIP